MTQTEINFDLQLGRILRDKGMDQVSESAGEWKDAAGQMTDEWIEKVRTGVEFIGEDIRLDLQVAGLPSPHHHNAWSAVIGGRIRRWLKSGRIEVAGWAQGCDPKAHARRMVSYRKVG
jgi:hypothetical protein